MPNYPLCPIDALHFAKRLPPVKAGTFFFDEVKENVADDGVGRAQKKQSWSAFKRRNHAFIADETSKLGRDSVILDIGAGPGVYQDIFSEFKRYVALDFCCYPGIRIVSNIVQKRLPIKNESVDFLVLANVLEHVNKPERVLRECLRVMKNDARILLITPFIFKLHQEPYDFYRYTHYKLKEMLSECGFENIKIRKTGTILEVFQGIRYELNRLMKANARYSFILNQFLRAQYHLDRIVWSLFLRLGEEALTEGEIFVGYSCTATKAGK